MSANLCHREHIDSISSFAPESFDKRAGCSFGLHEFNLEVLKRRAGFSRRNQAPCRAPQLQPTTSRVVAQGRFLALSSSLGTDTTCFLCALARSPCKYSGITACSKKMNFSCQITISTGPSRIFRTHYSCVLPCLLVLALHPLLRCACELHLWGGFTAKIGRIYAHFKYNCQAAVRGYML